MENLEVNKTEQVTQNEGKVQEVKSAVPQNDSELSKKIQSAEDRVRTEYTKKIKALEEQLKELQPKELSTEEKALQDKLQALEQKEKEIARKEMELKVSETLKNNGLPQQLSKYLNLQGVEDVESYLGEIKEVLNIQLSTNTYKPNAHKGTTEGITKEQFNRMSYVDRLNLFKNNEELYKQLSK